MLLNKTLIKVIKKNWLLMIKSMNFYMKKLKMKKSVKIIIIFLNLYSPRISIKKTLFVSTTREFQISKINSFNLIVFNSFYYALLQENRK